MGDLTILVFGLFQTISLARSRLPLDVLLLTLITRPPTLQCLPAALQGAPTRLQKLTPTGDRLEYVLLDVWNVETEMASTLSCTPLQVINPAFPGVLGLIPLICGGVACVGGSFPLVGFRLALVGDSFPLVRDELALIRASLTGLQ